VIVRGHQTASVFQIKVGSGLSMEAKRYRGRPASFATINNTPQIVAERQSNRDNALASDNQADTVSDTAT
jgi:hypothetical protein